MSIEDFFRGQVTVYAECVARGCKRIAEISLADTIALAEGKKAGEVETQEEQEEAEAFEAFISSIVREMGESFLWIAKDIVSRQGVKVYYENSDLKVGINGEKIARNNFIFYKDDDAFREYQRLMGFNKGTMSREEYHRRMGKLFGYGKEEIKEFIRKSLCDNVKDVQMKLSIEEQIRRLEIEKVKLEKLMRLTKEDEIKKVIDKINRQLGKLRKNQGRP